MSVRRIAFASGVKKSSAHSILRKDLCLKPYKPQNSQELKEGDDIRRLAFWNRIEDMIQDNDFDPGDIIFSDESHVYVKCSPNKKNNREWRLTRPENRTSVPLHPAEFIVWCELNSSNVIGPFFYEDPDTDSSLTVTKELYTQILMETFPEDSEEANINTIFMKDGAPAHTTKMAVEWLEWQWNCWQ